LDHFFPLALGSMMFIIAGVFILVSKPSVWQAIDRKSSETNSIRKFFQEKFPDADVRSMSFGRVFIRIAGLLSMGWGTVIILSVLFKTS